MHDAEPVVARLVAKPQRWPPMRRGATGPAGGQRRPGAIQPRYLTTLEYRYVYQATPDDESWILRYEYVREPPEAYPYAREHLHVNAAPASYTGAQPFPGLHLPTGRRITIERLVRHLMSEHGIDPISPDCETAIADAEAHFRDVQKKRVIDES